MDSFAGTVGSVVVTTLRQASVPEHLLGRVTSAYRMIALGAVPVGGLLSGALASAFRLRAPFLVGAIALAVFAVVLAPVLTTRRLDAAIGRGVREGTLRARIPGAARRNLTSEAAPAPTEPTTQWPVSCWSRPWCHHPGRRTAPAPGA